MHVKERETSKSLAVDEVKLLKSQDAGYVRLAIAKDESVSESFGPLFTGLSWLTF